MTQERTNDIRSGGKMKNNNEIRKAMLRANVKQWEVADQLGISEFTYSRWLRTELSADKKSLILQAIEDIRTKKDMDVIKLRPTKEAIINAVNILECLIRSGEQYKTFWIDENGDGFEGDQGYINEGLEAIRKYAEGIE